VTGHYSIKQLEALTGIKAHTLRIWEQRHEIVVPKRTQGNTRYYTSEDVRIMLNVVTLYRHGSKISEIAKMTKQEICCQIRQTVAKLQCNYEPQINSLITSMIEFKEAIFDKTISASILKRGFEKTITYIIFPLLQKIDTLLASDSVSVSQKQFIYNLIRRKLFAAIESQEDFFINTTNKYLLFLPKGEDKDLPLLFAHYLIKQSGGSVCYLGTNICLEQVQEVSAIYQPDYLFTLVNSPLPLSSSEYFKQLTEIFPSTPILIGGTQVVNTCTKSFKNIMSLCQIEDIVTFVQKH
jgi:DNA-binding transcriptional MerR regulator